MLVDTALKLRDELGGELFEDHNVFLAKVSAALKRLSIKLSAAELKLIINAVSWRAEEAPPVIKKIHKPGKGGKSATTGLDPLRGIFEVSIDGKNCLVEYEPDSELRDYEQIPLLEEGGIESLIRREVLRSGSPSCAHRLPLRQRGRRRPFRHFVCLVGKICAARDKRPKRQTPQTTNGPNGRQTTSVGCCLIA
ncbi:MAG: hypothetical protein ACI9R3_003728 [Verrucomicrobiales bacterium]|jgi:hypothetical protein